MASSQQTRRDVTAKKSGEPGWKWRRSVLIGIICVAFYLLWAIVTGPESRTNETIAVGLIWAIFGSGLIYAGFATIQDVTAIWVTKSALPYSPQSSPAEPTPGTPGPEAQVVE
jgi:hypothetical protein